MPGAASPTLLSHYRLVELIGRGGMGEVWLAEDTELPRRVAIKLLPPHLEDDREAVERLLHEARTAASVEHPAVVTIYEAGVAAGRAFLVMQRVEGETLEERLTRGPLPPAEAVELARRIADALAEVHALGIVHRDLKPSNVVLSPRGPKILDFGIASMRGAPRLTSTGLSVGTPGAMAPEQFRGQPADNRSDLWSLGVILYRALTGVNPFPGASYEAVMHGVMNAAPPPPSAVRPGVPHDVDFVVMKLLRKDPAQRYSRADELVVDLRSLVKEPTGERPPGGPAEGAPRTVRLAVLPFELLSSSEDDAFLAEGLVEDLIVDLAQLDGFQVSPRADVMPYRQRGVPPRTIARELGVDYVVLGSVRRAGNRARISVQLLRATDGHVQWAERFDRTLEDLFEVQSQISKHVVRALAGSISPQDQALLDRPPTQNPEAYALYLRARAMLNANNLAENRRAEQLLLEAVKLDPRFARALGALAECYAVRHFRWWLDENVAALDYATRALALDPNLAEAHLARAHIAMSRADHDMLREAVRHIRDRNPDDEQAIEWASFAITAADDPERVAMLPILERAVERFPGSHRLAINLSDLYATLGRTEDSQRMTKLGLERVIESVRRHPEDGHARSLMAVMLARNGDAEHALTQASRASDIAPEDGRVWYNRVCTLSILGRVDEAIELFQHIPVMGSRARLIEWPATDPDLANMRRHPDFPRLYEQLARRPAASDRSAT